MNTLQHLQDIFQDVFNDDELIIAEHMSAEDIPEWDSLMHVTLMFEVESSFQLRFASHEIAQLNTVGDLMTLVDRCQAAKS